uniref:G-protein coupled receptors family 1 profile domain-containing protein n=1 Tax=Panagrolaimus sp. JU765 TaxID=591449 RepID=A0AC34R9H8_9BILA
MQNPPNFNGPPQYEIHAPNLTTGEFKEHDNDQNIGVALILGVGIVGLTANLIAIVVIIKTKTLHNCFGYLLFVHAVAEAIVLSIFIFWTVPITIIDDSLAKTWVGVKIGHLVQVAYYTVIYSQLFKAVNRLIAIISPIHYRNYFTDKNAKFYVPGPVIFGFIQGCVYFFPGCGFFFDSRVLLWNYAQSDCYNFVKEGIDLGWCLGLMSLVILIDIITLVSIIKTNAMHGQSSKEFKFFIQTFSTSIMYLIMIILTQIVSDVIESYWGIFLITTMTWEICHAID